MKCADVALYVAKRKHTSVELYDPKTDTNSPRRIEILAALRTAVLQDELQLHYQPKIALRSGEITEVEALCRWDSATFGSVEPAEFIAIAEASDVIKTLTEWTIERAMSDCRRWYEAGMTLRVAVNLSARHLQDAQLPGRIAAILRKTRTRADWLELEITESAIMMDPDRAAKFICGLHDLGVSLSIDDFGTWILLSLPICVTSRSLDSRSTTRSSPAWREVGATR